jgi:hypothetical protein
LTGLPEVSHTQADAAKRHVGVISGYPQKLWISLWKKALKRGGNAAVAATMSCCSKSNQAFSY